MQPVWPVLRRNTAPAVVLICGILAWQAASTIYKIPPWLVPSPADIFLASRDFIGVLPYHTLATTLVTLAGFGAAAVFGFVLALPLTAWPFFKRTVYPFLLVLQSMPKIAIAPLLLMWVGFGASSKIIIVFLVCFFPVVLAAISGLESVPEPLLDIARSFSAPWWRVYLKIRIPYSLPYFFMGLKVSVTLAVTGAVVGEFVASREGLGFLILNGVQQFNTPLAFAAMLLLGVLTIVLYGLVTIIETVFVRFAARDK
jgi:NitT/TauT family transport system permease protein